MNTQIPEVAVGEENRSFKHGEERLNIYTLLIPYKFSQVKLLLLVDTPSEQIDLLCSKYAFVFVRSSRRSR